MKMNPHVGSVLVFVALCAITQGNIFTNKLLNRARRFDPMHNECGAENEDRQPCGRSHDALGKFECMARGCCFDERNRVPAGTTRCYLAARMLSEICNVDYREKDDCGYFGITEGECIRRECCWKPSPRINDPECFYPKKANNLRLMMYSDVGDSEGRVEVMHEEEWGTICDDSFGVEEANVICKQLGFAGGRPYIEAYYGSGSGQIWMDSLACSGNEENLEDCSFDGWGRHDCSHSEDAGVECYNEDTTDPSDDGSTDYWGDYEYRSQMKPSKKKGGKKFKGH